MTQTLRRERRQKFEQIIRQSEFYREGKLRWKEFYLENETLQLAEQLAIAAESQSEARQGEENVELFRGDFHEYPEHLWKVAEVLRDTWKFVLPAKPQKGKGKGPYSFFVMQMEDLKLACGEFGEDVLKKVYTDWKAGFKDGLAPYTVAQPGSLVNMARAKALELRQGKSDKPSVTSMIETIS